MPGLYVNDPTVLTELPGDPLSPGFVGFRIADEDGRPGRRRRQRLARNHRLRMTRLSDRRCHTPGPLAQSNRSSSIRIGNGVVVTNTARAQEAQGTALPGGAASSQDRKPVSASVPMAISNSSCIDWQRSTVDPRGMA